MLKGIDISKWQNNINLDAVSNQVDFVICKATEGVGYTDGTCDSFYQKAKSLGKKLGVYHFARPDLNASAIEEADYFLKETKGYWKESLLILDWEPNGSSIGNVNWAKQWMDRVYSVTGVKPLIYMSASVMCSYDWSSVANADYGLWVANYYTNDGAAHEECFNRYPVKHWKFYALWQYTSVGHLNGFGGNLDMNVFTGDQNAWDKYAGKSTNVQPVPTPVPAPVKKSNEEIANEVIADKWGTEYTNPTRKERLEAAGYNYDAVQAIVNQKLGVSKPKDTSIIYYVKKGDTLINIANKYGTTYQNIAKDNGIANPNFIRVGQKLVIKK